MRYEFENVQINKNSFRNRNAQKQKQKHASHLVTKHNVFDDRLGDAHQFGNFFVHVGATITLAHFLY